MVKVWSELGENVIRSGWMHIRSRHSAELADREDDNDRSGDEFARPVESRNRHIHILAFFLSSDKTR
jgi:hypothetical protein